MSEGKRKVLRKTRASVVEVQPRFSLRRYLAKRMKRRKRGS